MIDKVLIGDVEGWGRGGSGGWWVGLVGIIGGNLRRSEFLNDVGFWNVWV